MRREALGLLVDDEPELVSGVWTLRVVLPAGIVAEEFIAATEAENVPWLRDGTPGRVRLPFSMGYDAEAQEQLVLVAAKVVYYLRQTG